MGLFGCFVLDFRSLAGFDIATRRGGGTSRSFRREKGAENFALRAAEASAGDRRLRPENYVPIPEDAEPRLLQVGVSSETRRCSDIVTATNGVFVFQGRSDKPRDVQDVVPIVPK
ncbi:hypothetical protein [Bradyrhizobium sp. AS23.2]|uniref:hypothetical protein n=1 Tax=Bradyrhizobium sp. AS23.2 TaxID=1680155 RepID=UPI00116139AB|nr:hypothetical protein [Bradyrhizobium sp. AS23.2]